MAESVVKASVIYDVSSMQEGSAETVEALKSMSQQATVTAQTMMSKSEATAAAAKAAAGIITQADVDVARSSLTLVAAKKEERRAFSDVAKGAVEEADGLTVLAFKQAQTRAATLALTEAQKELKGASHEAVTELQATSGTLRTLEGNAGLRAVEVFASKTLGLGPVLRAVFPLVGAAAFGQILFGIGEKMYEVGSKAAHAGEQIAEAFQDAHEKAMVANDDLAIQNDKLGDEIAKLSGHPGDGLQTALDEARKMADKLLESLQADRKELDALLKEHDVSALGSLLSGVASTGVQATQMEGDQKSLTGAVRKANEDFEATLAQTTDKDKIKAATDVRNAAVRAAYQSQIDTYHTEALRLKQEQQNSVNDAAASGDGNAALVDNSAKIANIEGRGQQLRDQLRREQLTESIDAREQQVGRLKQNGKGGENKADDVAFKALEAHLAEWKTMAPVTQQAELAYWQAAENGFTVGSEKYNAVVAKEATLTEEIARKAHAGIVAAQKREETLGAEGSAAFIRGAEGMQRWQLITQEDLDRVGARWADYWRTVARGEEINAAVAESSSLAQVKALEAAGGISRLGAAQVEARIHAEAYRRELKELEEELARLEAAAAKNALTGNVEDPKQAAEIQRVKNQIAQRQGQGAAQSVSDQAAVSTAIARPYLRAFDDINHGWLKVQQGLIAGNKNIGREFALMGGQMVQNAAQAAEQVLAHWLQKEIEQAAAHRALVLVNTATDAAGASAGVAIQKSADSTTNLAAAKKAFKNTYSVVSGWPVVGPILAPVLAAGAFAAVEAFEMGGIVKGSPGMAVPVIAHAGERVLTAAQTNNFERMVNNSSNSASSNSVHARVTQNFHGAKASSARETQAAIHDLMRRGKLSY